MGMQEAQGAPAAIEGVGVDSRFANRKKAMHHGLVVDHALPVGVAQSTHDKDIRGRFGAFWIQPRGQGWKALADLRKDVVVFQNAQIGFNRGDGQGE